MPLDFTKGAYLQKGEIGMTRAVVNKVGINNTYTQACLLLQPLIDLLHSRTPINNTYS